MMKYEPGIAQAETARTRLLRRLWAALPALVLLFLVVGMVGLFIKIRSQSKSLEAEKLAALRSTRPAANVVLLTVNPGRVRDSLSLPGVVEPWEDLEVVAEVPGKVVDVPVTEGGWVRKGDVIARIDSRDYENALASIRASYDLALKTLKRKESLFEKEIIPRADLDNAQAEAGRLEAELKNAELRLERTVVTAPMDGTVNRLDAKEGLYLDARDPVALVLDTRKVKVGVGIPESDVEAVRGLKSFEVTIDALGGKTFTGRRHFLSRAPETMARLYRLDVRLENPGGKILPGMFARVNIVKQEVSGAVTVPLYSVITREEKRFVFVEKDGRAEMRMVETGILDGWRIQITRGLEPGDRVVVVGHRNAAEGQELNVMRTVSDPEELFR